MPFRSVLATARPPGAAVATPFCSNAATEAGAARGSASAHRSRPRRSRSSCASTAPRPPRSSSRRRSPQVSSRSMSIVVIEHGAYSLRLPLSSRGSKRSASRRPCCMRGYSRGYPRIRRAAPRSRAAAGRGRIRAHNSRRCASRRSVSASCESAARSAELPSCGLRGFCSRAQESSGALRSLHSSARPSPRSACSATKSSGTSAARSSIARSSRFCALCLWECLPPCGPSCWHCVGHLGDEMGPGAVQAALVFDTYCYSR